MLSSRSSRAGALLLGLLVLTAGGAIAAASGGRAAPRRARAAVGPQRAYAPGPATAAFGLDVLRRLGPGNVVFSPDSIATAMAMVGIGARGATASQIASALHLSSPASLSSVGDLQQTIAAAQRGSSTAGPRAPTLQLADAMFLQPSLPVTAAYSAGLTSHFGAAIQQADFEHDLAGALEAVNGWVAEHTQGLIPHILDNLEPNTVLLLANAIYLKATWEHEFDAPATSAGRFHTPSGARTAQFMHETTELAYGRGRGYAAVALPYADSTLSLVVVEPVGQSTGRLLRALTPARLTGVFKSLSAREVRLSLPRFHISLRRDVTSLLESIGIVRAFTEAAELQGVSERVPLKVSVVEHAADFAIDEHGTLAAAATTVEVEPTSARSDVRPPVAFAANRPFLFFLRDARTGTILFAGRVADPAAGG